MFPLRSCSTFMAGAPELERKLTGVDGSADVDAAIEVFWFKICFTQYIRMYPRIQVVIHLRHRWLGSSKYSRL